MSSKQSGYIVAESFLKTTPSPTALRFFTRPLQISYPTKFWFAKFIDLRERGKIETVLIFKYRREKRISDFDLHFLDINSVRRFSNSH
uniref:Uncharacterized protein n=1 Tax=Tetraselmis sp. GSL018 TaxID=582737 RepID=A0A061RGI9_9CHLO